MHCLTMQHDHVSPCQCRYVTGMVLCCHPFSGWKCNGRCWH